MRLIAAYLLAIAAALAGCAAPAPLDVSSREPVCARRCLEVQSSCVSTGATFRGATLSLQRACRENAENCLSTCPPR